ncbi:MAG: hypothetical protein HY958_00940 [Bacteroidia bacterium]|nr:hypothetical protein [Bacteroidia bacterium]
MKKYLILFILTVASFVTAYSGEIKLDGIFQGKNLYVQNPFTASGVGFCVFEVSVNGKMTTDEINSSAFEIDLSVFQLNIGDKISIVVKHKENCTPKILNPEVLKPKSTFKTSIINVERDGTIKWTTTGESGKLTFVIEQFRWNKWVKVGEIEGKGTTGPNEYTIKSYPHSGDNKFRVKQTDFTGKPRYSDEVKFKSIQPSVSFSPKKAENDITFTSETMYEIYDSYGNIVLKGHGNKVDVSKLKKGDYFLNFDNQMADFKKK